MARAEARYGPLYEAYHDLPVERVAEDPKALRMGERLFASYCAVCHGADAGGVPGFPNLRDAVWQWGGSPEAIRTSILAGRDAAMPPWREPLGGDAGVDAVTAYVLSLSGRSVDATKAAAGREKYDSLCVACHAPDGTGNPALGGSDLTDDVWLYGGSEAAVRESIADGRQGRMPAHGDFLGEARVHVLGHIRRRGSRGCASKPRAGTARSRRGRSPPSRPGSTRPGRPSAPRALPSGSPSRRSATTGSAPPRIPASSDPAPGDEGPPAGSGPRRFGDRRSGRTAQRNLLPFRLRYKLGFASAGQFPCQDWIRCASSSRSCLRVNARRRCNGSPAGRVMGPRESKAPPGCVAASRAWCARGFRCGCWYRRTSSGAASRTSCVHIPPSVRKTSVTPGPTTIFTGKKSIVGSPRTNRHESWFACMRTRTFLSRSSRSCAGWDMMSLPSSRTARPIGAIPMLPCCRTRWPSGESSSPSIAGIFVVSMPKERFTPVSSSAPSIPTSKDRPSEFTRGLRKPNR